MAENILKLKKQATALGMERPVALKANRKQLEDFIAEHEGGKSKKNGTASKKAATKAVKKAVTKKGKTEKPAKAAKPKKAATKTKAKPVKAEKTKTAKKPVKKSDGDVGRAQIGSIDWTVESDDWNPRAGGPTEIMFKALKKAKGDVDKAFAALKGDIWDFVGKKMRDGTKRDKASAEAMLRYRLNRTKFEFATRTGQHEIATNRVEYGTGGTSNGKAKVKKTAKKTKSRK